MGKSVRCMHSPIPFQYLYSQIQLQTARVKTSNTTTVFRSLMARCDIIQLEIKDFAIINAFEAYTVIKIMFLNVFSYCTVFYNSHLEVT